MRQARCLIAIIVIMIVVNGCALRGGALRPGAVDRFDSDASVILEASAQVLVKAKASCPSGPTSPCPQATKDRINAYIAAYDSTRQIWLDYRAVVQAGKLGNMEPLTLAVARLITARDNYRRLP